MSQGSLKLENTGKIIGCCECGFSCLAVRSRLRECELGRRSRISWSSAREAIALCCFDIEPTTQPQLARRRSKIPAPKTFILFSIFLSR